MEQWMLYVLSACFITLLYIVIMGVISCLFLGNKFHWPWNLVTVFGLWFQRNFIKTWNAQRGIKIISNDYSLVFYPSVGDVIKISHHNQFYKGKVGQVESVKSYCQGAWAAVRLADGNVIEVDELELDKISIPMLFGYKMAKVYYSRTQNA